MSWTLYRIIVFLCALTSAAFVLLTSTWGVGTTPDSVQYILAARGLVQGESMALLPVHWPPLYPLLIALPSLIGVDPLDALRWVNALIAAACAIAFGSLVRPAATEPSIAPVLAMLLFTLHPGLYSVFFMAWSEPLFILLLLAHFLFLRAFLFHGSQSTLLAAASCVGLAMVTRYAGAAFAAAGVIFLVTQRDIGLPSRLRQTALYAVVASLPLLAWLGFRMMVGEPVAPRQLAFHPVDLERLASGIGVLGGWFLPQAREVGALAVVCVVLIAACVGLGTTRSHPAGRLRVLLLHAFAIYMAFLLISISFFDFYTSLDLRILSPGAVLLLAALGLASGRSGSNRQLQRVCIGTLIVLFMAANVGPLTTLLARNANMPSGYLSPGLRYAPLLDELRRLKPDRIISNAPELVRLVDGRHASLPPALYDPVSGSYRPGYVGEMDQLMGEVAAGGVAIVMFHAFELREYLPDGLVFEEALASPPLYRGNDGVIFFNPHAAVGDVPHGPVQ